MQRAVKNKNVTKTADIQKSLPAKLLYYYTHTNDLLGSLADKVWNGPEGGQDPFDALAVAFHVVFQTCGEEQLYYRGSV